MVQDLSINFGKLNLWYIVTVTCSFLSSGICRGFSGVVGVSSLGTASLGNFPWETNRGLSGVLPAVIFLRTRPRLRPRPNPDKPRRDPDETPTGPRQTPTNPDETPTRPRQDPDGTWTRFHAQEKFNHYSSREARISIAPRAKRA